MIITLKVFAISLVIFLVSGITKDSVEDTMRGYLKSDMSYETLKNIHEITGFMQKYSFWVVAITWIIMTLNAGMNLIAI
jgi:hypothetical protein